MRRREFIAGLVGEAILLRAQILLEYDVDPIDGDGPIYLPSIQLNDASFDIDRKLAIPNEVHSEQRRIGGAVRHINGCSPNVNSERWVSKT
jgi:hypothetical protein